MSGCGFCDCSGRGRCPTHRPQPQAVVISTPATHRCSLRLARGVPEQLWWLMCQRCQYFRTHITHGAAIYDALHHRHYTREVVS